MSSESGSYYVESAEQIRVRRCAAAEDRRGRVADRLEQLRARADALCATYGTTVSLPSALDRVSRDADRAEADVEAFDRAVSAAADRVSEAFAGARTRDLTGRLTASLSARVEPSRAVAGASTPATPSASSVTPTTTVGSTVDRTDWRHDVVGSVERVMGRIAGVVSVAELAELEALAQRVVGESSAERADGLLVRLRERTQEARDAHTRTESNTREVERLSRLLDGLTGSRAVAARLRLGSTDPKAALPAALAREIEEAAQAARAEMDRAFVAAAAADALAELGYRVEEGFEVAVSDGSGGIARLPGSSSHGVRLREDGGKLHFNVVRFEDTDATRDALIEQSFCDSAAEVQQGLRLRGVAVELKQYRGPGIVGLQVLRRSPLPGRTADDRASVDDRTRHR